jgi:hypothetical protein
MHRAFWSAVALTLMSASYGAGRMADRFRPLPAIVATLPGEEAEFSRELDGRIRERFPIGTSEDKLIDFLASENFVPDWRRRDIANSSSFVESGFICRKIVRVRWRADAAGLLTEVGAVYESQCL